VNASRYYTCCYLFLDFNKNKKNIKKYIKKIFKKIPKKNNISKKRILECWKMAKIGWGSLKIQNGEI
jgi:cystathionine beta-lyase family protein involved in aluminum resistance